MGCSNIFLSLCVYIYHVLNINYLLVSCILNIMFLAYFFSLKENGISLDGFEGE